MTRCALSWSGGKDSMLALDRARRQGIEVVCLFNIYEGSSDRVRFHGVRKDLIQEQADALAIPLLQDATHPDDYESVFLRMLLALRERDIDGIAFGNIHLADIRSWYEVRVTGYGFQHLEPLWGDDPASLIREFIDRGYQARIVSIDPRCSRPEWLGAPISDELLRTLEATDGIDICGESGEYHSFVYDGPLFHHRVAFVEGGTLDMEGHRVLDLFPTSLKNR